MNNPGNPQHQKAVASQQQISSFHFSGPLPPSAELARYEETLPGAADRILKMAESQSLHRQDLEGRVIGSDIKRADRGQIYGFILSALITAGSFYLITIGKDVMGISAFVGTLITLGGAFIYGTISRKKERAIKTR